MEPYLLDSCFTVYTHRMGAEAEDIVSPFEGREYACLVALGATVPSDEARRHLARELVRTNCRYVVLLGSDYDPLLTDLLEANRKDYRYDDPDAEIFMMHWYESSEMEEASYALFALCSRGDSHYKESLILFLNTDEQTTSAVMQCVPDAIKEGQFLWAVRDWLDSKRNGEGGALCLPE